MESSNIRTAAISAFRNSLPIFLATVAIIPAISIFRRVFDDTWYVNWSSMLLVSGILTGCFFAFFLIAQTPDLSPTTKREHERPSDFPAVKWLRGVYLLGVLIGFALMIGIYKGGNLWWIVALLLGFVLVGFFAWPRVIQITALEIRQRGPLLALKRIANAEIEDLIFNPARHEVVVIGTNGEHIVHTAMHVDTERFIEQVKSITGKEVIVLGGWL